MTGRDEKTRAGSPIRIDGGFLAVIVGVAIRLALQTALETPVPSTDHVFYREAGVSLAAGEGFRATAVRSRVPGVESYFAAYPPVFPLAFGAWTFLFGFTFRSHFLFAALLQGAVILFMYRLTASIAPDLRPLGRLLLGGICVTTANLYDRPESLALPVLLVALGLSLASEARTVRKDVLSGALFAIAMLTSPVPALIFLAFACALRFGKDGRSWGQDLGKAAAFGGLVVGSAVFTFLASLGFDASLIAQFLHHAVITGVRHSLGDQWFATVPLAASIALILVSVLVLHLGVSSQPNRPTARGFYLPLVICAGTALYFVFVRTQSVYLTTLVPLAMVIWSLGHPSPAWSSLAREQPSLLRSARLYLGEALLVPALALNAVPVSLDILHGLNIVSQPGQTFEAATVDLRHLIPEGSRVAGEPAFWYVLRGYARYTDASWMPDGFSGPGPKRFDYIVVTGNGVGRPGMAILVPPGYHLCADRLNRVPLSVAGFPLTRSAWGYGYRLYSLSEDLCKYSEATPSSFPQLFFGAADGSVDVK